MLWGRALLDIGAVKRGREVLEWTARNRPDLSDAHLHLAELSLLTGDLDGAISYFEAFRDKAPADHEMRPRIEAAVKEMKNKAKAR